MAHRALARWLTALLTTAALAPRLGAQGSAKAISLEIRPRVGDTLRMRMDQSVEMTGTAARRDGGDTTMTVSSTLFVATRAVVESADATGTVLVAVTDSVRTASGTLPGAPAPNASARHALVGRALRLLVAPDGATTLLDDPRGSDGVGDEVRALLAQMPATLPRETVVVGQRWTREMTLPTTSGGVGGGVKAVFRLDSLTHDGDLAWISMKGAVQRDSAAGSPDGVRFAMTGTVTGALVVDRRRGWMTSSRTTLSVRSTMTPPPGVTGEPLHFRTRIVQWMRTAER